LSFSVGGLPVSPVTHTVCLTDLSAADCCVAFEGLEAAASSLQAGIERLCGRRLMTVPASRLLVNAAFHSGGTGGAAETQTRVPFVLGHCPRLLAAQRPTAAFAAGLDPKLAAEAPAWRYRVFCEGPHGVFFSAVSAEALLEAVRWFLRRVEDLPGHNLVAMEHSH